jgi:hypothetical protein
MQITATDESLNISTDIFPNIEDDMKISYADWLWDSNCIRVHYSFKTIALIHLAQLQKDIKIWVKENRIGQYVDEGFNFWFEKPEDAAHFKLRWKDTEHCLDVWYQANS